MWRPRLPSACRPGAREAGPAFVEAPLERAGGETALYALFELRAAETSYGRLHLLYSQAEQRRAAALARTLFYGLVGTSFALMLAVLNLLVARIVIAPVRRVMQAMREASTGALEARLPVHSADEIGSMAASFNRMTEDLQASKREIEGYSRNLEGMVAERTRALQESEAALLRVKTHLATVLANVGTGVVSLDPEGRVQTLNRRAAEILHLGAGPAEGRPLARVLPAGAEALARLTGQRRRGAQRAGRGAPDPAPAEGPAHALGRGLGAARRERAAGPAAWWSSRTSRSCWPPSAWRPGSRPSSASSTRSRTRSRPWAWRPRRCSRPTGATGSASTRCSRRPAA